jgi:hypothetical protein
MKVFQFRFLSTTSLLLHKKRTKLCMCIIITYIQLLCHEHFQLLFSFMTYHRVCHYINTTGATSGARTAHPSGAPEFTPVFSGVRVTRSLVLCVCFVDRCLSFVLFSSPGKVQVNYCHHLASVVCRLSSVVCRLSSVNFSHFKLLLRNHLADWNQT